MLTAALLVPTPAVAQSIAQPRTWTVTPFLHTSLGIGDPAPDDSIGLGVAVGYDLTYNLGFEGEISHLFDVAGDTNAVDWPISNFSANALYHFDVKHVTPYVTFGLGVERSSPGVPDFDLSEGSSEVSVNFGGGVKYPITDRWVGRADLRRFQANDTAPDYWRLYGGVTWVMKR
jgi:OOP family OmpA-OmpF porin